MGRRIKATGGYFDENKYVGNYFLNGDGANSVGRQMVVPFNKTSHVDFDYDQSSNRMAIECAFGIFIRRFVPLCVFLVRFIVRLS